MSSNRNRTITTLLVSMIVAAGALPAVTAHAAEYHWVSAQGGAWPATGNWNLPGFPRSAWDVAHFDLDASYEVDASDASQVSTVGMTSVEAGDVRLRASDGLVSAVGVGTTGVPARLTLLAGTISTAGVHTVGPNGTLILADGASLASSSWMGIGFSIEAGGVIRGDGGSLDNRTVSVAGTISPGMAPGQAGELVIGRAAAAGLVLRESSVLEVELGGATPGAGYDRLRVDAAASAVAIDGTLVLSLIDGFVPEDGQRFDVVVAPSVTGSFAAVELPDVAGLELEIVYEPAAVGIVAHRSASMPALSVDVLPAGCRHPIAIGRWRLVPAALIAPEVVDWSLVDLASVRLAGVPPVRWGFEDVGAPLMLEESCGCEPNTPDGIEDVVFYFPVVKLLAAIMPIARQKTAVLTLTGTLTDGTPFEAQDCLDLRPRRPNEFAGEWGHGGRRPPWLRADSRPSDPSQQVVLELPETSFVTLSVYDVHGRKVADVLEAERAAGQYVEAWDASRLPSGVYFYRLDAGASSSVTKLVLMR